MSNLTVHYGLVSKSQAIEYAKAICSVFSSNEHAVALLVETAAAETLLGAYRDPTPYNAGTGVTQVDVGTFNWLKEKYKGHWLAKSLLDSFGIHLGKVSYSELETSPLLSFIFCRLRYYTVRIAIPATRAERAEYWKRHYNTSAGKGTPKEYLERCELAGVNELLSRN
ncbi:hypothetical protein L5M43_06290 [Shewanella sp. SW36]|uniref:hypothetical protein n=1 Tax=unclassified Shewanella TaxID=196818 RepID=UPI0021DB325E|nr:MULTISPECIES: hypothetical protein [unclassified Shewanella]MCU7974888.1 hypothetical protein [Shewanella sp. SW36]MCU7990277.1 hypothetical protein [Shewanella sp. SW1]MCU8052735.1 hypothetical protein [Shewanella sp. SM43]